MATKVAINGFGRIGRLVLRAFFEYPRKDIEIVAVNGTSSLESMAHLFKYDSVHGRFQGSVEIADNALIINGQKIPFSATRNLDELPWKGLDIDVVMECTGKFTKRDDAAKYLAFGKRVLISAPGENSDATIVYGVNHQILTKDHLIVSNGSCTTNCLAPVADILHKEIGIASGFMTTIHAYTSDQNIHDGTHKDLRRARAAALSMVPTSTGAAKSLGLVIPQLKGKLDGTSIRVPAANVSMIDLAFVAARPTSVDEINNAMKKAAAGSLKGILAVSDEPLVSTDFNHDPHSAIFDLTGTNVIDGTLCRVMAWYDNEWGFSVRMLDVAALLS